MMKTRLCAIAASAVVLAAPVAAQDWQPRFDLLTAGAAASVMLHHLCTGAAASQAVTMQVAQRLQRESYATGFAQEAQAYAQESYRLKLRAFELSTSGQSCHQLERLTSLAVSQGFPVPRR